MSKLQTEYSKNILEIGIVSLIKQRDKMHTFHTWSFIRVESTHMWAFISSLEDQKDGIPQATGIRERAGDRM